MKKAVYAVIPAAALLFASCNFWNEPVKDFFEYWTSEAYISGWDARAAKQSDNAGVTSIASGADAEVLLKAENPKGFHFIMPTPGCSEMIDFTGLSAQPVPGTDYALTQVSADTLKLTYKSSFLQAHEWGNGDFGAVITLHADDGRKFKRPYSFNLKANTPPPAPTFILAKTVAPSAEYVLCLKVAVSEMTRMVNGELLHKDIAKIDIGGNVYDLTVNAARTDFVKPADAHFIDYVDAAQLTMPPQPAVPAGAWVLYYKTGVSVGSGAYREYPVRIMDEKGLVSETLTAGTATTEPPAENVTVTRGEQGTGSGTYTAPFIIKGAASAPEALLQIGNVAGTTVHCKVTEAVSTADPAQYEGNPVTFPLTLNGQTAKLYKVEYYTDGTGFKPSQVKTKYYKVAKSYTITFSVNGRGGFLKGTYNGSTHTVPSGVTETVRAAAGETITFSAAADTDHAVYRWTGVTATPPDSATTTLTVTGDATVSVEFYQAKITGTAPMAWRSLLKAIKAAPDSVTLKVSGTIRATNDGSDDTANYGEIVINKNLTIEGKNGAVLDANASALGANAHRIFRVESDKTLTLKNLTLKNGKKAGGNGGGIYSEGTLTLENTNIESSTAANGGAISNRGTLNITGGTFSKNTATSNGGAIYSNSGTVTLNNATIGGTAADANKAQNGGGICLDGSAGMTLTNCQIINNEVTNGNGGGIHFKNGTAYGTSEYTISGGKISGNKVKMTNGVLTYSGAGLSIENIGIQLKLDGCEISSNTIEGASTKQPRGAGIWLGNQTTCTIKGSAQIKDNKLHKNGDSNSFIGTGGGIQLDGGTLMLEGGTIISGNNAKNGGGLYVSGGAVTMTGGSIEYNKTIDGNGGGVYVSGDGASFTMTEGKITHCTADVTPPGSSMVGRGGGIYGEKNKNISITIQGDAEISYNSSTCQGVASGGGIFAGTNNTLTVSGNAAIKNNSAKGFGGGVYSSGTFRFTGGTIEGNNITLSSKQGTGIFIEPASSVFTMSGTAHVKNDNDIYLVDNAKITVNAPLTGTAPVARITPEIYDKATQVLTGGARGTEHGKFEVTTEVSGSNRYFWAVTENGKLARFVDGSKSLAWKNLKDVVSTAQDEDTIIIANRIKATDESGNSNKGEIRIEKNLTIQGNTGKASDILDADGKNRIFSVANDKKLTLKNLTLENGSGDRGGGIRADSNCTLTITGCILKGNKVDVFGGGISAGNTAITMKDCTLTGNVAHEPNGTASGGVIYADGNKMLTIENCTFTGNKGDYGGCIRTDGSITLTIKNCTFTGNEGRFGGCIYAANSTVRIEGGSIGGTETGKENKATDGGGSGGGIYIDNDTTLTLKNCTVTGNTAQAKGGGVYVKGYNAKLLMEGSAIITPAADKNDVYLDNNNMITVNNTLSLQGGTAARITPAAYNTATQVLTGSKVGTEHTKFTVTPELATPPKTWLVGSDGMLKTP